MAKKVHLKGLGLGSGHGVSTECQLSFQSSSIGSSHPHLIRKGMLLLPPVGPRWKTRSNHTCHQKPYPPRDQVPLKVHKHEIILNFFFI